MSSRSTATFLRAIIILRVCCWDTGIYMKLAMPKGPVTLPKIRVNAWITHKIWLCVLVRREFDHFCWLTWWKITDELHKNYGKITHKSLTNHALQRIGTKRPQTGRMRGCAWRIRDGKPRIISALSLVNCVWIAHDSRMNCAKKAREALKLRSFRAYKTDAAAVPWHSRFNSRRHCSTSFLQVRQVLLFHPCQGHPKFWP